MHVTSVSGVTVVTVQQDIMGGGGGGGGGRQTGYKKRRGKRDGKDLLIRSLNLLFLKPSFEICSLQSVSSWM